MIALLKKSHAAIYTEEEGNMQLCTAEYFYILEYGGLHQANWYIRWLGLLCGQWRLEF